MFSTEPATDGYRNINHGQIIDAWIRPRVLMSFGALTQ